MKRGNRALLRAVSMLSPLVIAHAGITLTDLQNHRATVEIVQASETEITFTMQGKSGSLKMEQLSAESRAAAIAYAKSKGLFNSFPAVRVQVKIAYQRRNNDATWYKKDVKLLPSTVIEGIRKMDHIPAAEASIVIITQDTKEKYVKHNDKFQVYATETIQIPAGKGERREFTFKTVKTTFDSARDPTNAGGDEYRYYLFGLHDPVTKKLINFQTNSAGIQAYVAQHPEERENLLSAKVNSPFTDTPK